MMLSPFHLHMYPLDKWCNCHLVHLLMRTLVDIKLQIKYVFIMLIFILLLKIFQFSQDFLSIKSNCVLFVCAFIFQLIDWQARSYSGVQGVSPDKFSVGTSVGNFL